MVFFFAFLLALLYNYIKLVEIIFFLDSLENWSISNSSALPQLARLLRTLFLKANVILHTNGIDLNHTLELLIEAFSRLSKKELELHLFMIIGDVMFKCSLNELHRYMISKKYRHISHVIKYN